MPAGMPPGGIMRAIAAAMSGEPGGKAGMPGIMDIPAIPAIPPGTAGIPGMAGMLGIAIPAGMPPSPAIPPIMPRGLVILPSAEIEFASAWPLQPMPLKLHIPRNLRTNCARIVSQPRNPELRVKFLGDRCAAHLLVAFEHERLEPGLGEIKRGDEAIVAASDNHDVARVRHVVCERVTVSIHNQSKANFQCRF